MSLTRVSNLLRRRSLQQFVNVACVSTSGHNFVTAESLGEKPARGNGFKLRKQKKDLDKLVAIPPALLGTAISKVEVIEFTKIFPDLVQELTRTPPESIDSPSPPANRQHFGKVLQYNVASGKKNRGLATVLSYKMLAKPEDQTPENLFLARIMGWCLELFHSSLLVAQDTIDKAETRRRRPAWHIMLQEQYGDLGSSAAFNDSALLKSGVYQILRIFFGDKPYYKDAVQLFLEMSQRYNLGQALDLEARADKSLSMHTMERYLTIVRNKTAHHSFRAPVTLALFMTGVRDNETHRQVKTIQMEMAQFFQVQNNFLDCYADTKVLGRPGTDIEDGRLSWLSVVALQRASPKQRKIMQECYGEKDPEKVAQVKELYSELELPFMYKIYEDQSYDLICTQVQQNTKNLPHKLFFKFLEKIYVRNK
ncbi:farnesyl pyrophosphate synthase-like isoform X2 [Ischnura elegans]|uniref:farnesyl pyrophosphate synthase-like isoform X2 n=1 Tax=Ischnura elegans TaxID=197161 RepID=UPI001ED8BD2A|nr:farnesyl pyrophosphate synthase-like isoform X2 [Ischnura elegans]